MKEPVPAPVMKKKLGLLVVVASTMAACLPDSPERTTARNLPPPLVAQTGQEKELFPVPPPPFREGVFPCSDCHEKGDPGDTERRPLEMAHTEIVLHHDAENRWCLDCHDAGDRDQLHLASGAPVSFEESYRLCGQCHGDKYRDWKLGVHGRRTGMWNGRKEYLLCVNCHDAHSPHFKPLKPKPAPHKPVRTP
ncbi:MAG: hypothetical protein ACE5H3_02055 [Planctomycetota bacterium]